MGGMPLAAIITIAVIAGVIVLIVAVTFALRARRHKRLSQQLVKRDDDQVHYVFVVNPSKPQAAQRRAHIEQFCRDKGLTDVEFIDTQLDKDGRACAKEALANGADVVLIDTAGRLHNKVNLMNELTKIRNVMGKVIPGAPHEVMLVLDGSTGQNAFEQARQFTQATQVTSLTITKLDGTAKGGVVIGISDQFHIPVRYIGIGEGIDQLRIFDRREFVNALFGHETK